MPSRSLAGILAAFSIPSLAISGPLPFPFVDFGTKYNVSPNGVSNPAQILTAWNWAISDCNSGAIGGFFVSTGTWQLGGTPNAITAPNGCHIWGDGAASELDMTGTGTAFFTLGNTTAAANAITISDISLKYLNTPISNSYVFVLTYATNVNVKDVWIANAASWIHVGSTTAPGPNNRILFQRIIGDMDNGLNDNSNILVEWVGNIIFRDIVMSGNGTSNTNGNGAIFRIAPQSGSSEKVDTLICDRCTFQSYDHTTPPSNGKPYGFVVDATNGDIYNQWFTNSIADHTTKAAIYYINGAYGVGTGVKSDHFWSHGRFTPDAGACVLMNDQSGVIVEALHFSDLRCSSVDATTIPVQIVKAPHGGGATNYKNDLIDGMIVAENLSVSLLAAFQPDADGWQITNWNIGSATSASHTFFQNVFSITNPDLTNLVIGRGAAPYVLAQHGYVAEPTYTTPNSPGRQIWFPQTPGPLLVDTGVTAYACNTPAQIVYTNFRNNASKMVSLEPTCAHEGVVETISNQTTGIYSVLVQDVASSTVLATLAAGQVGQFEYVNTTTNWKLIGISQAPP